MGCQASKSGPAEVSSPVPLDNQDGSQVPDPAQAAAIGSSEAQLEAALLEGHSRKEKPAGARKALIGRKNTVLVRLDTADQVELSECVDDQTGVVEAGDAEKTEPELVEALMEQRAKNPTIDKAAARRGLIGRKESFLLRQDEADADPLTEQNTDTDLPDEKESKRRGMIGRKNTFLVRVDGDFEDALAESVDQQTADDAAGGEGVKVPQRKLSIQQNGSILSRMDTEREQALLEDLSSQGLIGTDERFIVCTTEDGS